MPGGKSTYMASYFLLVALSKWGCREIKLDKLHTPVQSSSSSNTL